MPSQLRPALALVRGAGERVEPLPEPAPHAVVLLPDGGGLSTADGLRRGRPARARPRRRRSWRRSPRGCATRPAPAPRRSPTPSCSSTTSSRAARSLRPAIGDALDALREAGAPLALLSGSGPTAVGLFADLAAARAAAAAIDRDDAIVCEAGRAP